MQEQDAWLVKRELRKVMDQFLHESVTDHMLDNVKAAVTHVLQKHVHERRIPEGVDLRVELELPDPNSVKVVLSPELEKLLRIKE